MKHRIGIVGTGQTVGIAHFHALGLLADDRAQIAAVYNTNAARAHRFIIEHGLDDVRVCASYIELLDCVDAVVICSPNFTHIDYVLGAIQAGKAFFVEKPLGLSAAETRQAMQVLRNSPTFNMVGFVYRYAAAVQMLRELSRNEIGRVYTFSGSMGGRRLANPENPIEWRMLRKYSGAGALADFGSHLIDLAFYTAGLTFEAAGGMTATLIRERPPNAEGISRVENDDQAAFVARTAGDALASFTVSRVGMDEMTLLVVGEGGLARLSLASPEVVHFQPAAGGIYATEMKTIRVKLQKPFDDWFVEQMRVFIDGLCGVEVEAADIPQGHYVESVLEAAGRASELQPVRVIL